MDDKMDIIIEKYGNILGNYKYVNNEELFNLPANTHLIYINKNDLIKKSGFLIKFNSENILQIINLNKKWHVYIDQHYIFKKIEGDPFKIKLLKLLDSNFDSITNK